MTNTPTQAAIEAAARAVDRQLAFEVDSTVRAHELTRDEQASVATAAIEAYRAAMREAGFVMVPVEPTESMKLAGAKGSGEDSVGVAWGAWDAMIAARPQIGGE